MIKKFAFIFGIVLLFSGCERDDLCLENPATSMNTVFYDYTNQPAPKPLQLTVTYQNDTIVEPVQTDSILIPLPVHTNQALYVLIRGTNPDTINISYQTEDLFVSKACGFKTVYKNLQIQLINDSDNWIKQVDIIQPDIVTDTVSHVKIYH